MLPNWSSLNRVAQVFGLTGGIGSGKSLVADHFRARQLPVVDADVLSRQVVAPPSEALDEIADALGSEVLLPDGSLNRPRVADLVFDDPQARRRLAEIIHPRVRALARAELDRLAAAGHPLACYEVPLLFENDLGEWLRPVVVVSAPAASCLSRVLARDHSDPDRVRARMRAQLPLDEKARRADHVIDNGGCVADTLLRADQVLAAICASLGVDPARYPPR